MRRIWEVIVVEPTYGATFRACLCWFFCVWHWIMMESSVWRWNIPKSFVSHINFHPSIASPIRLPIKSRHNSLRYQHTNRPANMNQDELMGINFVHRSVRGLKSVCVAYLLIKILSRERSAFHPVGALEDSAGLIYTNRAPVEWLPCTSTIILFVNKALASNFHYDLQGCLNRELSAANIRPSCGLYSTLKVFLLSLADDMQNRYWKQAAEWMNGMT